MRFRLRDAALLAIAASVLLIFAAPSKASEHVRGYNARHERRIAGTALVYAHGRVAHGRQRGGHFAELVGDPDSGLGFYPLPWVYRAGAWRERQRHAYNAYNDIRFAIMSQAIYSYAWPYDDRRPGVFNPYDGYGTPFFAGYYGPGDPDAPPSPLGRPYR